MTIESKIKPVRPVLKTGDNVIALGSCNLSGDWICATVSIDRLKKILDAYSLLNENQDHSIDLIWSENNHVIVGKFDRGLRKASGITLARWKVTRSNDDYF